MGEVLRDPRWPLLCFCEEWDHVNHGNDMTEAEYAERAKMTNQIRAGAEPPPHLEQWHGVSVCPSRKG